MKTTELKLCGVTDGGSEWLVKFQYVFGETVFLEASIQVAKTVDQEQLIKVARAKFHDLCKTVASKSQPWALERDVVKALEEGS